MQYRRLKKKDRIYISGPITRDPVKARSSFARVERWLRWNGQDSIINPEKLLREQARTMSHGELLHVSGPLLRPRTSCSFWKAGADPPERAWRQAWRSLLASSSWKFTRMEPCEN